MGRTGKSKKPGPEPERLKIEDDPQEALRKLLSKPPPPPAKTRRKGSRRRKVRKG